MERSLNNLRVLVTAGANGIGLEIARAFAASGAKVHVCDRNESAILALASEPSPITGSVCDVSNRLSVGAMMEEALNVLGGLDVLVNNAGIAGPTGRVDRIDPEEWDDTLTVNITGQFNVTRLAVAALAKSSCPSILCISSLAGRMAFPNRSAYAASKWAIVGFMKTIAAELGELGIRVNAILPGMVDGPRLQAVFEAKAREAGVSVEEIQRKATAGVSIKELVPPGHIAAMAIFLASEGARSISGQAIAIDNDAQFMV